MKKIYYEKQGRKYVPVAEYDSDFLDSFTRGTHLVMSYPGGSSRRYNIDPDYAAMIAAGRVAEDAICRAISKAAELRPKSTPITPAQKAAWEALAQSFGDELCTLYGLSVHDCAQAGVEAMMAQAQELLANPTVRRAYERFLFVAKLARENTNG
jgi:hypothetical protein